MNRYAIVGNGDSAIDRFVTASEISASRQCGSDELMFDVGPDVSNTTHYYKSEAGAIVLRHDTPGVISETQVPADGETIVTISGLTPDTRITIDGPDTDTFIVPDGALDLTFARPGRYRITATAPFPALPKEMTLHAT